MTFPFQPPPTSPPTRRARPWNPGWQPLLLLFLLVLPASVRSVAATPVPAEAWLPTNTLAYVTLPSATSYSLAWPRLATLGVWADPALKRFRAGFEANLESRLLAPLATITGWPAGRLLALAEGQITLAFLPPASGTSNLVNVLLLDAGSRTNELAAIFQQAARFRTNGPSAATAWSRPGIQTGLTFRYPAAAIEGVLESAFPSDEPAPAATRGAAVPRPYVLHTVLAGSTFLALESTNDLPGILSRLASVSPAPARAFLAGDDPARRTNSLLHAWLDAPACLRHLTNPVPPALEGLAKSGIAVPRIFEALGLNPLQSASFSLSLTPEGWRHDLHLALPAATRQGIFRLLEPAPLEAGPPPFLGDEVIEFHRFRLDGPRKWADFEKILRDLEPSWLGVLQLFTGYAGRTEDADFDFEKQFLRLLGNDWAVVTAKVPHSNLLTAELYLHATTNATRVRSALTQILSPTYLSTFLPPDAPPPRRIEQTVAGQPMVTIELPPVFWAGGVTNHLYFGQRGDWIAASGARPLVESFLSAPPPPARPVASRPGFAAATRAAGGTATGWFSYEAESDSYRETFQSMALHPVPPPGLARWAALTESTTRALAGLNSWFDLRLLPPYETVSRHFGFRVTSGRATPEALHFTTYRPNPGAVPKPSHPNP